MNKPMYKISVMAFLGVATFAYAQDGRIGINTDKPKATLDLQPTTTNLTTGNTNEGLLIPRLTKNRVAAIDNQQLVKGTLVFVDNITAYDFKWEDTYYPVECIRQ